MSFDQFYQNVETVWGEKPDLLLADLLPDVERGRALDLGAGEGRNALYLAQQGFDVTAIDIAPTAIQKCLDRARLHNVPVRAEARNLLDVEIAPDSLALVVSAMALQFVKPSESVRVIERIKAGLRPGGMVYLTVFSTDDPAYARMSQSQPEVEPRTYFNERMGSYVHFFEKDELLGAFEGFVLYHFAQTVFRDAGHPGVPDPHYHGTLTYIGRKP